MRCLRCTIERDRERERERDRERERARARESEREIDREGERDRHSCLLFVPWQDKCICCINEEISE